MVLVDMVKEMLKAIVSDYKLFVLALIYNRDSNNLNFSKR